MPQHDLIRSLDGHFATIFSKLKAGMTATRVTELKTIFDAFNLLAVHCVERIRAGNESSENAQLQALILQLSDGLLPKFNRDGWIMYATPKVSTEELLTSIDALTAFHGQSDIGNALATLRTVVEDENKTRSFRSALRQLDVQDVKGMAHLLGRVANHSSLEDGLKLKAINATARLTVNGRDPNLFANMVRVPLGDGNPNFRDRLLVPLVNAMFEGEQAAGHARQLREQLGYFIRDGLVAALGYERQLRQSYGSLEASDRHRIDMQVNGYLGRVDEAINRYASQLPGTGTRAIAS